MKAVIVEDEIIAAQALQSLINEIDASIEVLTVLQSVEDSIAWFGTHPVPDLVFMDIHLADGASFAIFDKVNIICPIIFTTAYDEYALKAFEVNSIDYILKPINRKDLERAINKYNHITASFKSNDSTLIKKLIAGIRQSERTYKSCFLVSVKDKFMPLSTEDIAYIYVDEKMIKAVTFANRTYYLDQSLDELMTQLNPADFFRANRQYLIARKAIKDISVWFGSKLAVNLKLPAPEKIIISKLKTGEIKQWMAG